MPPIDKHLKISLERTGKDYREIHVWLDGDPEKKIERHDITRIYEYGKEIEERYGREALHEYIQHIHDDIKAKFDHLYRELEKEIKDILICFGIK